VSYDEHDDEFTETELSALRQVCLVSLIARDRDEALAALYDAYGEGDDDLLRMMMELARRLEDCTQTFVVGEYRHLCRLRPVTRNETRV